MQYVKISALCQGKLFPYNNEYNIFCNKFKYFYVKVNIIRM